MSLPFFSFLKDPRYSKLPLDEQRRVARGETTLDDYDIVDLEGVEERYAATQQPKPQPQQEDTSFEVPEELRDRSHTPNTLYDRARGVVDAFGQYAVGGGAKSIGDAITTVGETPLALSFDPVGTLTSILEKGEVRSPGISEQGRIFSDTSRFDEASETLAKSGTDPNSFLGSVAKSGSSVFPMAAAFLARNPGIGAGVMGGATFGSEYVEGIDELGLAGAEAAKRASVQSAIEILSERVGLGAFYKGGLDNIITKGLKETLEKNYGTKLAGTIIANVSEELAATEAQMAADEIAGYRKFTPEQKAQARMDAAVGGLVLGGGIGTLTSFQKPDSSFEEGKKLAEDMARDVDSLVLSDMRGKRDAEFSKMSDITESIRKAQGQELANASEVGDLFTGEFSPVKVPPIQEEVTTPQLTQEEDVITKDRTQRERDALFEAARKQEQVDKQLQENIAFDQMEEQRLLDAVDKAETPIEQAKAEKALDEFYKKPPVPTEREVVTPDILPVQEEARVIEEQRATIENEIGTYRNKLSRARTEAGRNSWRDKIAEAEGRLNALPPSPIIRGRSQPSLPLTTQPKEGVDNAETVRGDQGRPVDEGSTVQGSEGTSSENLQRQDQRETAIPESVRPEREGAPEDVASPEVVESLLKNDVAQMKKDVAVSSRKTEVRKILTDNIDAPFESITVLDDDNFDSESPKGFDRETDRGAYDPSTGKVYVNSKIVKPEEAVAVALHEIAHDYDVSGKKTGRASIDRLVGEENRQRIIGVVDALANQGVSTAARAKKRVLEDAKGDPREYLTYLIEEVRMARDKGQSLPRRVMNVVKDIVASVKGKLIDTFGEGRVPFSKKITEADILRASRLMSKGYTPSKKSDGEILKSKAAPAKAEQKVTGEDARQTRRTDVVVEGTRGNILEGMVPGAGKKARKPVGKSEMSPSAVARLIEDTLANAFGSLQGKPIEMVELQEIQEGLHSEAAVEAKQAGNRLTSILIWGVPRKRRKEVVRLLSTASSENKSERMEARRKLREVSPELYNEYLSLRDKIRYFGQEIINSILSTGRPLTNRDVALIKKIAKSGDFYLTRAFKAFAKSSKVRDTHRKLIMDSVRKYNKTGEVDEYSQIFLNAVDSIKKNHLDISNFLETEKSMEDAKKGGYRFMDVAEISSLATVWLGNKAPRVEAGMDADQKEAYIEKVRATLKEKMESLGNEDYKKQLDDKAKFVAQHLLGEVGGKGGGALLNLVEAISKDTSILQKKQNVLPEIRALLGEVINPIAQLEQTLMLQAEYLASANMQQRLYDVALEGNWISDTPDSTMHTEAIPDDTLKYGPLAGMWATREFKEKFEPLVEVSASFREALTRGDPGSGMADAAIDALAKGTSLSKMITVAYNLMNPVYNFFGGMVITPIQMGYALLAPTRRNARALKNAFSVVYSSLTPENRKGMTEAYKKILGAGLQDNIELAETQKSTRESLRNQILDDIAKDVTNTRQRILSSIGEASSVAFKKVPVWLTAESDRVWVYYAFFREKDFLKDYFKAKGEPKTEQQLEEIAAARVKMASINPGRQAKLIKSSEQKGATQFLNYFVETYKSIGRGLDLARIDLMEAKKDFGKGHKKAAAIRTLNASTRIAGLLAVSVFNKATTQHIAKIAMWGALFSMLSGDDDEDETLRKAKEYQEVIENMKKSLPLDEQGKDFVILARDGDKLFLQDVNRFDPLEPATAPLTSILEGDIDRAIAQVESLVFANSFLAGLYSAIAEPNKKVSWAYTHPEAFEMVDKKVKDLGGKFGVEASETFNFISKLVKPVTPRAAINFLNEMASEESEGSFEGESALNAIRYVGGWVQEYSPTSSVYRAAAGTKDTDGYNEVRSQLRKDYIGLANASADTIEQSLSRLITKEREAFNRMSEVYRSARAVANDKDAVDRELKNVINNRQIVRDIEDGTFNSGLWTEESKNSMISRLENSTQFKEKEIEEKIEQIEKLWEIYEEQRGD